MFVISFKSSNKRVFIVVCAFVLIFAIVLGIAVMRKSVPAAMTSCKHGSYSLQASNNSERLEFFGQFGWRTGSEPIRCSQITIPEEFNDVYIKYNDIQSAQGLDLTHHKGELCECYSYEILNYKDNVSAVINIIVHENVVIAGDVSSTELGGFMTGFFKE